MDGDTVGGSTNTFHSQSRRSNATRSPLDEALNLLVAWSLPQLCDKFREQEVCTLAFQHLNDADISELIPKVGPRSIFRSQLVKWRAQLLQQSEKPNLHHTVVHNTANGVIKAEVMDTDTDEQWLKEVDDVHLPAEVENEMGPVPSSTPSTRHAENEAELEILNESDFLPDDTQLDASQSGIAPHNSSHNDNKREQQLFCYSQPNQDRVDVASILRNNFDGRNAIEFYEQHRELDANHRKKIVKNIISIMIEKRISMSVNCFHDLARQLVALFPNESYSTYYVPRVGTTCPKGALYNKYLNMCKRLRREGLLEYRVQRRVINNNAKTRTANHSVNRGRN